RAIAVIGVKQKGEARPKRARHGGQDEIKNRERNEGREIAAARLRPEVEIKKYADITQHEEIAGDDAERDLVLYADAIFQRHMECQGDIENEHGKQRQREHPTL